MTKKHFVAVAKIIKNLKNVSNDGKKQFALEMIDLFRKENKNFKAEQFFDACGLNDTLS